MKLGIIYAGQGSQVVGMGKSFYPREIFDQNEDLKELCFNGPLEKLSYTPYTQPCMVMVATIITDLLKEHGIVPDYTAGLIEDPQPPKKSLLPVRDPVHGLFVPDAKQSWKRYSNISLAIIIATQAFFASLDPDVITALPENIQYYIAIAQALLGIGASVINQTKRKGAADV